MSTFYYNRWISLAALLIAATGAGTSYAFSLFTQYFKQQLNYSQESVNIMGSINSFGLYVGIAGGVIYNAYGPRKMLLGAVALNFVGFFWAWLQCTEKLQHSAVGIGIAFGLASQGSGWVCNAAVATSVHNFPMVNRGAVVGLAKGIFALSTALLAELYVVFFVDTTDTTPQSSSSIHFLLFLSIFTPFITLICILFINILPAQLANSYKSRFDYVVAKTSKSNSAVVQSKSVQGENANIPSTSYNTFAPSQAADVNVVAAHSFHMWYATIIITCLSLVLLSLLGTWVVNEDSHKVQLLMHILGFCVYVLLLVSFLSLGLYSGTIWVSLGDDDDIINNESKYDSSQGTISQTVLADAQSSEIQNQKVQTPLFLNDTRQIAVNNSNNCTITDITFEAANEDKCVMQVLRTPQFYSLSLMMCVGAGSGLMIINNLRQIIESMYGKYKIAPSTLFYSTTLTGSIDSANLLNNDYCKKMENMLVLFFGVSNCIGRMSIAAISDIMTKKGLNRIWILSGLFSSFAIINVFFAFEQSVVELIVLVIILGISFGGLFGTMAAVVADIWGPSFYAGNYACVDSGVVIGNFLFSTLLAGPLYQEHADYSAPHSPHLLKSTCIGSVCFHHSFIVTAICNLCVVPITIILAKTTRKKSSITASLLSNNT